MQEVKKYRGRIIYAVPEDKWMFNDVEEYQVACIMCGEMIRFFKGDPVPTTHHGHCSMITQDKAIIDKAVDVRRRKNNKKKLKKINKGTFEKIFKNL